MDLLVQIAGWICLASVGAASLIGLGVAIFARFKPAGQPQLAGTQIPQVDAGLDLGKLYDIDYGIRNLNDVGIAQKICGVRIIGYLHGDQDITIGNYEDGRWLVVESTDGTKGYLRSRYILALIEAQAVEPRVATNESRA